MVIADLSQYFQQDNINGLNGNIFLYELNVVYSDQNKYIKRTDNNNIIYYNYNNIKIVPTETVIISKIYDFTNYLTTHYTTEDMLNNFFEGLNTYLNEDTGKIINLATVLEYINPEETLVLNDFLDLTSINNDISYINNEEISYYFVGYQILETVKRYIDINGNILENNNIINASTLDIIYDQEKNLGQYEETNQDLPSNAPSQQDIPSVSPVEPQETTGTISFNYKDIDGFDAQINNLKKLIGEIMILMADPDYTMTDSSELVQLWVDFINDNIYTNQDIPNLSNLQQEVETILNN